MNNKQIQYHMHKNIENRKIKGKKIQTVNMADYGKYDILEYKFEKIYFQNSKAIFFGTLKYILKLQSKILLEHKNFTPKIFRYQFLIFQSRFHWNIKTYFKIPEQICIGTLKINS